MWKAVEHEALKRRAQATSQARRPRTSPGPRRQSSPPRGGTLPRGCRIHVDAPIGPRSRAGGGVPSRSPTRSPSSPSRGRAGAVGAFLEAVESAEGTRAPPALAAAKESLESLRMSHEDGGQIDRRMLLAPLGQDLILQRLRGMKPGMRAELLQTLRHAKRSNASASVQELRLLSYNEVTSMAESKAHAQFELAIQKSEQAWLGDDGKVMPPRPLVSAYKASLSVEPNPRSFELGLLQKMQLANSAREAVEMTRAEINKTDGHVPQLIAMQFIPGRGS